MPCSVCLRTRCNLPGRGSCQYICPAGRVLSTSYRIPTVTIDPSNEIIVRAATAQDAGMVAEIYNHYIRNTVVTFEEELVNASDFVRRMQDVQSASFPWLVAEHNGIIAGYAYATAWKNRSAYQFSAEVTVYLHHSHGGKGIGSRLYSVLIPLLQDRGIHALMGGIALPNEASVALHEKFGFRKIAHFNEVGFKFNRWIDVGYWQRILDGTSTTQ